MESFEFVGPIFVDGRVFLGLFFGTYVVDVSVFSFSKKIYSFKICFRRDCKVGVRGASTNTIKNSPAMNYNDSTGIAGLSVKHNQRSTFLLFNI